MLRIRSLRGPIRTMHQLRAATQPAVAPALRARVGTSDGPRLWRLGVAFCGVAAVEACRTVSLQQAEAKDGEGDAEPKKLKPATKVEDESVYDSVELDFISDSCAFCRMMKASPCYDAFLRFHRCSEYHNQRGEEFITPCKDYAITLWNCIQQNPSYFPSEVTQHKFPSSSSDDDEEEGDEDEGAAAEAAAAK